MEYILKGLTEAFSLLLSMDKEVYGIIFLSLYVSISATVLSTLIAVPSGILLGTIDFKGKKLVVRILYTFMSMPPVIAGLIIFLLLSRRGPLGFLGILFTPTAMIIAQTCLVTPIITGIVYNGTKEKGKLIGSLAKTLGANKLQALLMLICELRVNLLTGVITGLGRAISEVGAVMIVGGNIKGHTRVMTTTIAMLQGMGEYSTAIAIGLVLLLLAFTINSIIYHFQQVE